MQLEEAYHWLQQGKRRLRVLRNLKQPMTPAQLAAASGTRDACSAALGELLAHGLVSCLNPAARRSRVYWLSPSGLRLHKRLREDQRLPPCRHDFPVMDWDLYGWVCYSHRRAIVRSLTRPLQPSQIKRKAHFENPELRMSANNVRDAVPLLLKRGILRKLTIKGRQYPVYELTSLGASIQELLRRASSTISE